MICQRWLDLLFAHWPVAVAELRELVPCLGVASGDRVLLLGEASAGWAVRFYGAVLAGAIPTPLDRCKRAHGHDLVLLARALGEIGTAASLPSLGRAVRVFSGQTRSAALHAIDRIAARAGDPSVTTAGEPTGRLTLVEPGDGRQADGGELSLPGSPGGELSYGGGGDD